MTAACIICGATGLDKRGERVHEPCCPHFMRGPDAGGDPSEWGTLFTDWLERESENMELGKRV